MTSTATKTAPADESAYILSGKHTQEIIKLIDAAHSAGITPMLWGKPGVGKTALVEALATRPGFGGLVRVLTGSQDKSDTLGMPSRDSYEARDGMVYQTTAHATPDWVLQANDSDGTFYVFLDELPQADTDVQGTFLTVLQNHVMPSGARIKPHVKFIAAGNPTDIVASGFELIEPLTNRLAHFTYEPPKEEWFEGMMAAWGKEVSPQESTLRRCIVGYLVGHANLLHNPPEAGSTENAWPSRRSWDNLARMGSTLMDDKNLLEAAATSLIGKAAASDFVTSVFRLNAKSPEEIVTDPSCVDWTNTFAGFVGLSGVVSWMTTPEDALAAAKVFKFASENGPRDVVVTHLKDFLTKAGSVGGNRAKVFTELGLKGSELKDFVNIVFAADKVSAKVAAKNDDDDDY